MYLRITEKGHKLKRKAWVWAECALSGTVVAR
jgi:hypothetical protein